MSNWLWFLFVIASTAAWYALGVDHVIGQWGLFILLAIGGIIWNYRASNSLLHRCARLNGYQIISQEHKNFATGPFFGRPGKGHAAFQVTVYDPAGYSRSGWVRFGDWWSGLSSDNVEVRWDAEDQER